MKKVDFRLNINIKPYLAAVIVAAISFISTYAQTKTGYALGGSYAQYHALREDYGKGDLTGSKADNLEFWYIIDDLNAVEWDVTLTYPRMKEGMVDLTTNSVPEMAGYYPWGGWAGIKHNDQLFYTSKFVPTYSERYGEYGDYDLFHSAMAILTNTVLTKDGVMHMARVKKIGDYALWGSDIRVINLLLNSDINDGEDADLEFGDYVFYNCAKFLGVPEGSPYKVIPNNVTKIGKGIFKGCSAMTRMIIGDKLAVIPEETFDGCTSLKELKLGESVKEIKCSIKGLKRLAISAPTPPAIAPGCELQAEEIWVPEKYLETYQAAWKDRNIKPYSIKFPKNPVVGFAGYQIDVNLNRVSPGEGENNYVYCYPRDKDSNGDQKYLWTVDATHGSNTASGKFKTVWYSYDCDQRKALGAGNVVYEDVTRVRFDKVGTYKLYFTTLDITNHTEEVIVQADPLEPDYVPVEGVSITGGPNNHLIRVGGKDKLRYILNTSSQNGKDATYTTVLWESSNPEIATVDENGNIEGVSAGEVEITATTTDPYMPEYTATYKLTVIQRMEEFVPQVNYGGIWEDMEWEKGHYAISGFIGEKIQIRPRCIPEGTSHTSMEFPIDQFTKYPDGFPGLEIDEETGTILLKSPGTAQLNMSVWDGDVTNGGNRKELPVIVTCIGDEYKNKVYSVGVQEIESGTAYDYKVGYTGEVTDRVPLKVSYNWDAAVKRVAWEVDNSDIVEIVPTNEISTLDDDNEPIYHFTLICKKPGTTRIYAVPVDGGYLGYSFPVTVNKPQIVTKTLQQRAKISNYNTDYEWYTNTFSFEIYNDGTAKLVYPSAGETKALDENGLPTTPYNFDYPGDIHFRNSNYNFIWSPYMDSVDYKPRDLYYTALRIPETFEYENKNYTVTAIGDHAFAGSNVVCVDIPKTVTSIGDYAFKDAKAYKGLHDATFFNVISDNVTEIGKGVFSGCSSLNTMKIGNGLSIIPEETFDGCTGIQKLMVGTGVEKIKCSVHLTVSNHVLVLAPPVPPVFDDGCAFETNDKKLWIKGDEEVYKTIYPDYAVSSLGLSVTPSRDSTYVGSSLSYKYSLASPGGGINENLMFYPTKENSTGGNFTTRPTGNWGNDWITWSFDDLNEIYDASTIDYNSRTVSIIFATEGEHNIYFQDLMVDQIPPTEATVEAIPGVGVKSIVINNYSSFMDVGEKLRLNVTVNPSNATDKSIRWTTNLKGIVEVNEMNEVTALAPGKVDLTATSTDPYCNPISRKITITVQQSAKEIKMTAGGVTVPASGISGYPGDKFELVAEHSPANSVINSAEWSATSGVKIEGENQKAVVELLNPGRAIVTYSITQQTGSKEMRREVPILVKSPVSDISVRINGVDANLSEPFIAEIGKTYDIVASVNADASDKSLVWTINAEPGVVELTKTSSGAIVKFLSEGVGSISIASADGKKIIAIAFGSKESGEPDPEVPDPVIPDPVDPNPEPIVPEPVDPEPVDPDPIDPDPENPIPSVPDPPKEIKVSRMELASEHTGTAGDRLQLVVVIHPDNATNRSVEWRSSHPDVVSVSNSGLVELLSEGKATVTCAATDGSGISVACALTVKAKPAGIEGVEGSQGSVTVEQSQLIVCGLENGDDVAVYSLNGVLLARKQCTGDAVTFPLPARGIYIVVTPQGSFKVRY